MEKIKQLVATLEGKKTYIVSVVSAAVGLVQLVQGHQWAQVVPFILAGAFGGAIRAAIAKVEAKVDKAVPVLAPAVDAAVKSVEK